MIDARGFLARLRRRHASAETEAKPAEGPVRALVDPAFYLVTNPHVAALGIDPVEHFVRHGWREGRDPRPDVRLGDRWPGEGDPAALPDPATLGSAAGESPRRADFEKVRDAFDPAWYLRGFASGQAPSDPLLHYLAHGWREGRDPRPDFSVTHYLAQNPDIREAGIDPFVHYVLHGRDEGRAPGGPRQEAGAAGRPVVGPIVVAEDPRPDGSPGARARDVGRRLSRAFGVPVVPVAEGSALPPDSTAVIADGGEPRWLVDLAKASNAAVLSLDPEQAGPHGAEAVRPPAETAPRPSPGAAGTPSFDDLCFEVLRRLDPGLPTVSVIVPNYRYARYLPERMASVFVQTHPVREILFLDDASPDDSVAVARRLADEAGRDIYLHVSAANSGSPFAQWRRGLEAATGKFAWIAEADDVARPELLARLVGCLRETGASLAFCDSWRIDSAGARLAASYQPVFAAAAPGLFDRGFDMPGRDFVARALYQQNVIPNVSAVVVRREAFLAAMDRVGDGLAGLSVAGDWRLYLELCATDIRVAYVPEALNGHRLHPTSVTHALHQDRHLDEIAAMHATAARLVPLAPDRLAEQSAYMDRAREHLARLAANAERSGS